MDARLMEYAQLVVEVGLNVQKGQTVLLRAPIECTELARLCAQAAYQAGCREVITELSDSQMNRMRYLYAADEVFDTCPAWASEKYNTLAQGNTGFLTIYADDPNSLIGVDPQRIRKDQQARGLAMKPYTEAILTSKTPWCILSAPVEAWAAKVFPTKPVSDAMQALWDAIYTTMRITGDGKAVERWREHAEKTRIRCEQLNAMHLTTLHYQNALGTDLTIGLPEGAFWAGGSETSANGIAFIANMPTEEIFTVPHRERVNGRIVSSMPFVLNGNLISQFTLTFKDGKIIDIEAKDEREHALLQNAIAIDEGAAYLGEVALVPFDSPISNLGILFYNTLFDENASCHFAFGKAYPCIEGADDLSEEELKARGVNDSLTHEDFMVGTPDLSITGTTADGQSVAIFADGNFAF